LPSYINNIKTTHVEVHLTQQILKNGLYVHNLFLCNRNVIKITFPAAELYGVPTHKVNETEANLLAHVDGVLCFENSNYKSKAHGLYFNKYYEYH